MMKQYSACKIIWMGVIGLIACYGGVAERGEAGPIRINIITKNEGQFHGSIWMGVEMGNVALIVLNMIQNNCWEQ